MGKLGKVFGVIVLLLVVAGVGLMAFVKYYLTDERIKAIVIPQAETALGRKVTIGDIKIGLFSGITIKDFVIKEEDTTKDFVSTKAFVLSYDLLPLLQKKLVISEIRFDQPTVQVIRTKKGDFNYSTLALLTETGKQEKPKSSATSTAAVPLALTIDQIRIIQAKLSVRDQLNKLPAVDATTNAKLRVSFGQNLAALQYKGSWDLVANADYGETKANLKGSGNISQQDLDIAVDVTLNKEVVNIKGDIKNYAKAPNATLELRSKALNVDNLLGIAASLPKGSGKPAAKKPTKSAGPIADSLPDGLVAKGNMIIDKAIYKGLSANDLVFAFTLNKGILAISELSANAYGGKLNSSVNADLNKTDPVYDGKIDLQSMQADSLTASLVQKAAGMLTGSLQSSMNFAGAGTTWDKLKRVLTADGEFSLQKGGIMGTPASAAVAGLLGLPELKNLSYENITGTFTIVEGGKVKLNTQLQSKDVSIQTDGILGLDGALDLPLTLKLSPALAEKLKSRASFTQYLTDGDDGSTLKLKLAGTLKNPQPTLDMKGVQDQLQKSLQKKLLEGSGETESGESSSPENMIKGLFGK
jgi:type II secretion system protein N